jgi:hypothetical protein
MLWPVEHLNQVAQRTRVLHQHADACYCFVKLPALQGIVNADSVFNPWYFDDIARMVRTSLEQVHLADAQSRPCLYIITSHGDNIAELLWALRAQSHPHSLMCLWHFDNHVGYDGNYRSALACDLNFVSHNLGVPGYLCNPVSPLVNHVPACTVQFGLDEIIAERAKGLTQERISKGLFNYVTYPQAQRTALIEQLSRDLPDVADFKLMPSGDRTRYWKMTRSERFMDWAAYKCSVIVPLHKDLSTRVFDALATGQIPVVPEEVQDLDLVLPRARQLELGIVRIADLSSNNVRSGIAKAIQNFDAAGPLGIVARSDYVLENAHLVHRIQAMLDACTDIANGKITLTFGRGNHGIAAYAAARASSS